MTDTKQRLHYTENTEGHFAHPGALEFILHEHTAVISTLNSSGGVSGAVVSYTYLQNNFYIMTRNTTRKARNIFADPQVSLTIFNLAKLQELQIEAIATLETDPLMKRKVFNKIISLKMGDYLPPITKLHNGSFVIFRLTPVTYSFSDFRVQ